MRVIFMIPTQPPPKLKEPEKWTAPFHDFIAQALIKDPAQRPSAATLLKKHPFIRHAKTKHAKKIFSPLLKEANKKVEDAGSRKLLLGLESSSEQSSDSQVERPDESPETSGEGGDDYNSGTCVVKASDQGDAEEGYGTTKVGGSDTVKEGTTQLHVPQYLSLLNQDSKRVRYEAMGTAELQEKLNEIESTKDQELATLRRNYEMDTAILQELEAKESSKK